jgi:hypothetical protein
VQPTSSPSRERAVPRRVVLGGLALLAVVAIGAAVWVLASRRADTLDPAIAASLASQGITLAPPPTTSVPTGKEQAKATAYREFPNGKTNSTAILAKVLVQPNANFNCTCWVVARLLGTGIPPPGGPVGYNRKASANQFQSWMRYNVTFIDAQSGKYEFAVESYIPAQPSPK